MGKTIKQQILSGYKIVISIMVFLTFISLIYSFIIKSNQEKLNTTYNSQTATQDALVAHYKWIDSLSETIQTGKEFTGSLDYTTCAMGVWVSGMSEKDLANVQIMDGLNEISKPHEEIHMSAKSVILKSKTDRDGAYYEYLNVIKPKVNQVISGLSIINGVYQEQTASISKTVYDLIKVSMNINLGLTIIAFFISLYLSAKTSAKITLPITRVTDWSKKLSLGVDDLNFEEFEINENSKNEVHIMAKSFREMARTVKNNVNVIKKVADGDMTAFVDIRSADDSLGKNLYRMVQTNDLMFAEILGVAATVAMGSEQIAHASQALSHSSTVQAEAVDELTCTVHNVNELTQRNSNKAEEAMNLSMQIKLDAEHSNEQMNILVNSVEEIREASDKISTVIKSIDDIAFQTNILALNAAIEAARAGEAGKGFAVVANEVRDLALKSASSAQQSKELIENTIEKTHMGNKIARETLDTFEKIVDGVNKTADIIADINVASAKQHTAINEVTVGIRQVADVASSNAASTEESAAASLEMNHSAEQLKGLMGKFNLRERPNGKAYIPPEKKDDKEFIMRANENYEKAKKLGRPVTL